MRHNWTRYFFYRCECLKTTWTFRLATLGCVLLVGWLTRGIWIPGIGWGLVCRQQQVPAGEAMLLENFDASYLVFERAATIRREGSKARILVPVQASTDATQPNLVSGKIADVMAEVARTGKIELIPIRETEPISLNAAYQVRDFLQREGIHSVLVLAPALRSRRSSLVYGKVFGDAGIVTSCLPIFGAQAPDTWFDTLHGMEQVLEQYVKLEYYRLIILPRAGASR